MRLAAIMEMGNKPRIKCLSSPLNEMKGWVTERKRKRVVGRDGKTVWGGGVTCSGKGKERAAVKKKA